MQLNDVSGKKVLVTGAAMGLGKLFATRAAAEGAAALVLWDINESELKATAAELEANGATVHHYVVDVSAQQAIADAAEQVRQDVGDIDILINNAGIVRGNNYFWETEKASDITQTMAINSLAPMYITLEFLPPMVAATEQKRVLNIASSAGLVPNPRMASYAASKWAAVGWSDSVRLELEQDGRDNVKITTVCPTYISTGMFDGAQGIFLTPTLEPEDVVDAAWKEMKKGGPFVVMPWTSRFNQAIGGLMPVKLRDKWLDTIGVYKSMSGFTGHKKE